MLTSCAAVDVAPSSVKYAGCGGRLAHALNGTSRVYFIVQLSWSTGTPTDVCSNQRVYRTLNPDLAAYRNSQDGCRGRPR